MLFKLLFVAHIFECFFPSFPSFLDILFVPISWVFVRTNLSFLFSEDDAYVNLVQFFSCFCCCRSHTFQEEIT
jgi:hypothetical protein